MEKMIRYEVTDVWGCMTEQLDIGSVVRDKGVMTDEPRQWEIMDMNTGQITGGFVGVAIGEMGSDDDALG